MTAPRRGGEPSTRHTGKVLDAALALFDEAGYAAVTIEDIRRRSEVSASSIYHRFGDKAGIAGALYVQALADFQVGLAHALE